MLCRNTWQVVYFKPLKKSSWFPVFWEEEIWVVIYTSSLANHLSWVPCSFMFCWKCEFGFTFSSLYCLVFPISNSILSWIKKKKNTVHGWVQNWTWEMNRLVFCHLWSRHLKACKTALQNLGLSGKGMMVSTTLSNMLNGGPSWAVAEPSAGSHHDLEW